MKVIFDFDDVILNSGGLKNAMFTILEKRGYHEVRNLYDQSRSTALNTREPFSMRVFLQSLRPSLLDDVELVYQQILGFSEHLINHEVFDIIKRLGKENCYIVTNGADGFQEDKIRRSIGEGSVREIIVVSGSKSQAITDICKRHLDENVIFVDDRSYNFNDIDMEQCQNLKTVLFNENGLQNLEAEIMDTHNEEQKRSESLRSREQYKAEGPQLVPGQNFGIR